MKRFGYALIGLGTIVILFSALADALGPGRDHGLGAAQILGLLVGVASVLLGIGLLIINRDPPPAPRKFRETLASILQWPPSAWVLATFLSVYAAFFVIPVFFSQQRIRYVTRYIPDAYITHIGFDISKTLESVQAWLLYNQSPYDGFIIYSPVALVILAPLLLLGYPAYYHAVAATTFLAFCAAFLIAFLMLRKHNHRSLLMLFFLTGLFSYGFQFELERGQFNLIAFTLTLSALYLFHFHHKFRYFAYFMFSLAIQLKIYPVIFMLLFVRNWRDWAGNLKRALGLGLINFTLFFILGFEFFKSFISGILSYQLNYQTNRLEDLSIRGFVHKLTSNTVEPTSLSFLNGMVEPAIWLVLIGCLLAILMLAYRRQRSGLNPYLLAVCTVIALIVPSASVDYKLPLLAVPMAMVFVCLPEIQGAVRRIGTIVLIVIASAAYWSILFPNTVKPAWLASNFPALFVIMVSITLLDFMAGEKIEGYTLHAIDTKDA